MKRIRKIGLIFSVVSLMIVTFTLNTKKSNLRETSLSNFAALSVAQAEYGDIGWCALISAQLCYVNSWTGEVRQGIFQPN
ncbi:MAG: hypothetical protein AB2L20_30545 [Mangrovibacterium sp.]